MTLKKTLIIDNYDSFTYNLFQYIGELNGNPIVYKNDEITLETIKSMEPTHIILSPGPGNPENKNDFGVCEEIIKDAISKSPTIKNVKILGVCLGHQGIILFSGGKIENAKEVLHGKRSLVKHNSKSPLFKNVPDEFEVMRYHSLIGALIPNTLEVTAWVANENETIMAVSHKDRNIFGIQFHPESIGTPNGKTILQNFLSL